MFLRCFVILAASFALFTGFKDSVNASSESTPPTAKYSTVNGNSNREMKSPASPQADTPKKQVAEAPLRLPQCLNGTWREQSGKPFSWIFTVYRNQLIIRRTDNFVSGVLNRSGNDWVGQLQWGSRNGETWNNFVLTPNANCGEVRTNQSWSYRNKLN